SVKRWRSDSEPSHQTMLAGLVSLATSATQLVRCALRVAELPALVRVPSIRVNSIIDPIPPPPYNAHADRDRQRLKHSSAGPSPRPGRNPNRIHVGLARECKKPRDDQLAV